MYAGAEVTAVYFRCRHRQQLISLLQKYSKIERLNLVNTTHAAVISEFRHIVALYFEVEDYYDCQQLENLVSLTHLQSLSIQDCVCGGAEHFPWTTFSAMTYLALGKTRCSPDSQCKLPSALQVLHLSDLPGLDCLQDLPALVELHIDADHVYPEAIAHLTRLTNLAVPIYTPNESDSSDDAESDSSDDATKDSNNAMFCTIATLLNLRVLRLATHPSDFQVDLLSALTNLTELEIETFTGEPQCTLVAVQHLCRMSNLKQLNNLHFCSHPHYYRAASLSNCMLSQGDEYMIIESPTSALQVATFDITSSYTESES